MHRNALSDSTCPALVVAVHVSVYVTPKMPPTTFCVAIATLVVVLPESTELGDASVPLYTAMVVVALDNVSPLANWLVKSNSTINASPACFPGMTIRTVLPFHSHDGRKAHWVMAPCGGTKPERQAPLAHTYRSGRVWQGWPAVPSFQRRAHW